MMASGKEGGGKPGWSQKNNGGRSLKETEKWMGHSGTRSGTARHIAVRPAGPNRLQRTGFWFFLPVKKQFVPVIGHAESAGRMIDPGREQK